MSEEWLIALGLVLVLEGLLPTLAPKSWKKMVSDMASRSDGQLARPQGDRPHRGLQPQGRHRVPDEELRRRQRGAQR